MASTSTQSSGSFWELSLYDQHRKPQEIVADSSIIGVAPRALHAELMCPICLDLMTNTQTTKECLHRFCQECIITALRSGNKECPTCRKKLISKRSLRPDPNFDALIAKIYPEREETLNQQQEKGSSRRLMLHQRKRKASPVEEDEEETPSEKKSRANSPVESEPLTPPSSHNDSLDSTDQNGEVELQLRPHPASGSNTIRNLVTSPACTVSHLTKYLSLDKMLDSKTSKKGKGNTRSAPGQYCIYIDEDGSYSQLSNTTSLKQVIDNHWTPGEKLKLYFNREIES